MKCGLKFFGALLLACLLVTAPVGADPITSLGDITATHVGNVYGYLDMGWNVTGVGSGTARTQLFKMRLDDTDNFSQTLLPEPGGEDSYFYAFCIELNQFLDSPVTYDVYDLPEGRNPNPIGLDRANLIAAVLGAANFTNFGDTISGINGYTATQVSVAIQLAIWEVVYETLDVTDPFATAFNVNDGVASFTGNSGARTLANAYLGGIGNVTAPAADLLALNSRVSSQDLLVQVAGQGSEEPIPEPGTLALFGLGLLALGLLRKTRAN
jgi:hypothetical protein